MIFLIGSFFTFLLRNTSARSDQANVIDWSVVLLKVTLSDGLWESLRYYRFLGFISMEKNTIETLEQCKEERRIG